MTETIKQKALALVNEVNGRNWVYLDEPYGDELREALCRAIEQHEAFRQEVSDAVESRWMNILAMKCEDVFSRFIIAKADPLIEALNDLYPETSGNREYADQLRAALAARGLEIREKQP